MTTAKGFTIVELLIVIVVISILAAITVVTYNGVSQKAHESVAKADLENLAKALAVYRVKNERLPQSADITATPLPEVAEIFKYANLYTTTRRVDADDRSELKSFIYCSNDSDTKVAFIAVKPVMKTETIPPVGFKFMYADNSGISANQATVTSVVPGSMGYTLCAAVDPTLTRARWSYSIPSAYAP